MLCNAGAPLQQLVAAVPGVSEDLEEAELVGVLAPRRRKGLHEILLRLHLGEGACAVSMMYNSMDDDDNVMDMNGNKHIECEYVQCNNRVYSYQNSPSKSGM